MRGQCFIGAAAVVAAFAACGGTKGGVDAYGKNESTAEQAFYAQISQIDCDQVTRCCTGGGYAAPSCDGYDPYDPYNGDPTLGALGEQFDPGAASACLTAYQQALASSSGFCDGLLGGSAPWPFLAQLCPDLYSGGSYHQTPLGAACQQPDDGTSYGTERCAPTPDGFPVCATWTATSAEGTSSWNGCVDVVAVGEAGDVCSPYSYDTALPAVPTTLRVSSTCDAGLACSSGVCAAPLAFGASCAPSDVCADDLYCDDWTSTCAKLPGAGEPCTSGGLCASSAWCTPQGTCANAIPRGAACKSGVCAEGLACNTTTVTCEPPPATAAVGAACDGVATVCDASSYCDEEAGVCTALRAGGAACTGGLQCESTYCVQGVCTMASPAPVPSACAS